MKNTVIFYTITVAAISTFLVACSDSNPLGEELASSLETTNQEVFETQITDAEGFNDTGVYLDEDSQYKNSDTESIQPESFLELLQVANYTLKDITAQQLILVKTDGNMAQIYAYEVEENGCWAVYLQDISGYVGKNGITSDKKEGDKKTPKGLFPLLFAFGIEENPESSMIYQTVTAESYWVDDPNSAYYNQWVEGVDSKDWNSAEHLIEYPEQYAYAVVIGYNNDPIEPGKGSAIFLHCGNRPTAGCVSIPRDYMKQLLQWLNPTNLPMILIF